MLIYCARNTINGKCYVGLTTGTLARRMGQHRRKALHDVESAFYRSIRKRGFDAFEWSVLERCATLAELCAAERKWIVALASHVGPTGYNIRDGGAVLAGYARPQAEATKRKIRETLTGRTHTAERRQANRAGAARRLATGNCFAPKKTSRHGVAGVCFDAERGLWEAYISPQRKKRHLGRHADFFEAVCARKSAEAAIMGRL